MGNLRPAHNFFLGRSGCFIFWPGTKGINGNFRERKSTHFLIFAAIIMITTITRPTRKNAHHIPALKIVSTAPQLLSTKTVKRIANKNGADFIFIILLKNSTIIPLWKYSYEKEKSPQCCLEEVDGSKLTRYGFSRGIPGWSWDHRNHRPIRRYQVGQTRDVKYWHDDPVSSLS